MVADSKELYVLGTNDVLAGEDLRSSQDVRVDECFIDSQEGLVSAGTDPCGFATVLGPYVRHGRGFSIPVRHIQNGTAKLSFLQKLDMKNLLIK